MIETLKKNPRTIVFTEGTDNRILDAADKLTAEGILGVILLGTEEEVKAAAKAGNYNIEKCSIISIRPAIRRWMPWLLRWSSFVKAR